MVKQKFQSDLDTYKPELNLAQCMRNAVAKTGKSYLSQGREIVKLMRKPSLLTAQDYYYFQLYDDSRYGIEHKQRFLSDQAHWGIISQCCDRSWWALADDKHFSYTLLETFGAATPKTQCVFSSGTRNYGAVSTCRSAEELAAFFRDDASFPIFAKPNGGVGSFGVFLIEGYDSDTKGIGLFGGDCVPLDSFCQQIEGGDGYLLQDVLKPHPELVPVCGERISTVRVIMLLDQSSPEIIQSVWKIPAPDSIADNFWREGNMLGAIDLETGKVTRVVSGYGFDLREIETHPNTEKAIKGMTLPYWPELKAMCLEYSRVFEKIRYLSWDIALCPQGPVVVEVNTGSSFMLSQLATGEGFLTDRFCAFLENCGYFRKPRSLPAT
jgi:hypothetical protein